MVLQRRLKFLKIFSQTGRAEQISNQNGEPIETIRLLQSPILYNYTKLLEYYQTSAFQQS